MWDLKHLFCLFFLFFSGWGTNSCDTHQRISLHERWKWPAPNPLVCRLSFLPPPFSRGGALGSQQFKCATRAKHHTSHARARSSSSSCKIPSDSNFRTSRRRTQGGRFLSGWLISRELRAKFPNLSFYHANNSPLRVVSCSWLCRNDAQMWICGAVLLEIRFHRGSTSRLS